MAGKTVVAFEATLESNQAQESVKSFKQKLKEATADVIAMSEKFGVTSVEAANAAKKVAGLKDAIGDAKALSDSFNPDKKFVALGGALQGATAGFSALQGAMGLFGAESEETQKLLLKVQSAMALQQGISGIAGAVDSFKLLGNTIKTSVVTAFSTLKGALLATGIGALAVGVGLLIANFDKLKAALGGLSEAEELAAKTQDDFNKGTEEAIKNVTDVEVAFDLAKKGVISKEEALATYNETLGDSLGRTNDLTVAEKNLTDKAEAYIKITGLKAQANALFALSAQQSAKAVLAASDDQISFWDKTKIVVKGIFNKNQAGLLSDASKAQAEGVTIAVNDANANADLLKTKGEELLKQAGEIGKQYGVNANISGGNKPNGDGKTNKPKGDGKTNKPDGYERLQLETDVDDKILAKKAETLGIQTNMEFETHRKTMEMAELNAKGRIELDKYTAEEQRKTAELLAEQKKQLLEDTGNALATLSDVVGKETAAGKALAVAAALINTFQGISKGVSMGMPWGIPSIIAAAAVGFKTVNQILATKVPGKNGGGSSGGSVPSIGSISAPIQPQGASTLINQAQINQIGNAAARAYVIESDVSGNQERVRRLNRAARIN